MIDTAFQKIKPALTANEAMIEASRCLFCYDAPCTQACPSEIDVPMFIRQIMSHNPTGAAKTIFSQNILGKSCASVCPTQVLCEGACVYHHVNEKPIDIGRLQGFATDHAIEQNIQFFKKGPSTGKKVAVIGAGPAGLACAHELTRLGHDVIVYDAHPHAGGLNRYGVAPYKLTNEESDAEVDYIAEIGFTIKPGIRVVAELPPPDESHETISLAELENSADAVFLGMGLGKSKKLGIPGETLPNVYGAAEFIAQLRATAQKIEVGKSVVVIGAGNTAIDAAVECVKLGADVTVVYRRSAEDQSAYAFEVEHAKLAQVKFLYLVSPVEIVGSAAVEGLYCIRNQIQRVSGSCKADIRTISDTEFLLPCDRVILATGQEKQSAFYQVIPGVSLDNGKICVNQNFQTGNPRYFAGGDCVNGGKEVVNASAHGRDAARGIHYYLTGQLYNATEVSHGRSTH